MSHRALWEQLLNDPRQNYMVVAEDDAVPLVSSQRFIRKLPQDVDFVHFGCGSRCNRRPFIGAHCYLVTRAGARKYFAHWKNRIRCRRGQSDRRDPRSAVVACETGTSNRREVSQGTVILFNNNRSFETLNQINRASHDTDPNDGSITGKY